MSMRLLFDSMSGLYSCAINSMMIANHKLNL